MSASLDWAMAYGDYQMQQTAARCLESCRSL